MQRIFLNVIHWLFCYKKKDEIIEIDRSEIAKYSSNPKYIKNFIIPLRLEVQD